MSLIKSFQAEAFQNCKLEKLRESGELALFKLTPPNRFHWCYIVVTPAGLLIGGDQRFGDLPGGQAVSVPGVTLVSFLGNGDEEYIGQKFFGPKPRGRAGLDRWSNDVGWLAALRNEFKRLYTASFAVPAQESAP